MAEQKVSHLVSKIFELTIEPGDGNSNYQYLPELAQELIDEGEDLQLNSDNLDRLLTAKLMLPKEGEGENTQWTVDYLLGVYARSQREQRNVAMVKDKNLREEMEAVCALSQQLVLSNVTTQLNYDLFPQTSAEREVGALALLWAINPKLCNTHTRLSTLNYHPDNRMPPGFLQAFSQQADQEALLPILESICSHFVSIFKQMSILAEFQEPLQTFMDLISYSAIARTVTKLESWKAHAQTGRAFAEKTILGSMFCISSITDMDLNDGPRGMLTQRSPDVLNTLFQEGASNAQVSNGLFAVRSNLANLRGMLKAVVMAFLKVQDTREAMLDWLATALQINNEFNKEMMNAKIAAPRGFMSNLAAILLELCGPFLDFTNGKAKDKIDAWYCLRGSRLNYSEETRLHMTPEEETAQLERLKSNSAAESSQAGSSQSPRPGTPYKPHFICECYFMTLKAIHMGYIGLSKVTESIARQLQRLKQEVERAEGAFHQQGPNSPTSVMLGMQIKGMKKWQNNLQAMAYCLTAELGEDNVLDNVTAFYRLTAVWLLNQASPSYSKNLQLQLPLPAEVPISFKALPEYIFSDMADFFKSSPHWLDYQQLMRSTSQLVEIVMCFVAFMPASDYINNIYLRAQLAEVLQTFMPDTEDVGDRWGRRRRGTPGGEIVTLMATSDIIKNNLVRSLLQLFVEVERTGRHNQFYEKFYIRWDLGRLLKHLWEDPAHREVWFQLSEREGDLYSRFNYFLETDATLHLDDALKLLPEIRDFQKLPEDQQNNPEQRAEHERREGTAKFHLQHAKLLLQIINMTVPIIWKPWLQEQAIKRIAGTLNYFLKYLTGPERRKLNVKDAHRLDFDPKDFLTLIASIYIHFAKRDQSNAFAQAIAADKRSYYDKMFAEAAVVLRNHQLLYEDDIQQLEELSRKTAQALQVLEAEDAAEAEAPDEFFDPIMSEIMSDPVTLPSGVVVERETILRHLMSDPTDPFSRVPLAAADLKPNLELKERIRQWKQNRFGSSASPMES